jgi:hypothetical protein
MSDELVWFGDSYVREDKTWQYLGARYLALRPSLAAWLEAAISRVTTGWTTKSPVLGD